VLQGRTTRGNARNIDRAFARVDTPSMYDPIKVGPRMKRPRHRRLGTMCAKPTQDGSTPGVPIGVAIKRGMKGVPFMLTTDVLASLRRNLET
jgi:hypothetical protein